MTTTNKTPDINKILALPVNKGCSKYGADMGRMSQTQGEPERLHLQKMRFVDGAYDTGGAYWGMGTPLYCAFTQSFVNGEDESIRVFARANSRAEAKLKVLEMLPDGAWTFYQ
jgi:hypothetical protein